MLRRESQAPARLTCLREPAPLLQFLEDTALPWSQSGGAALSLALRPWPPAAGLPFSALSLKRGSAISLPRGGPRASMLLAGAQISTAAVTRKLI